MFKTKTKKFSIFFITLIILGSLSPLTARKASAQWIVVDLANLVPNVATQVKEYGLDYFVTLVGNRIAENLTRGTVNWINGGFRGKPAFVTNPTGFFKATSNQVAGDFIFDNGYLNFLCGPIQSKVKISLARTYAPDIRQRWECTLDDVVGNIDAFMGDFSYGGWQGFIELTQHDQNNPVGAFLRGQEELNSRIALKTKEKEKELEWGNGFLSLKECAKYDRSGGSEAGGLNFDSNGSVTGAKYTNQNVDEDEELSQILATGKKEPACLEYRTTTPGNVISTKLNDVLNLGNDKLAAADEINEIVSALLNQVVNRVVGGIGSGLRGLSRSDSGGTAFTEGFNNQRPGQPGFGDLRGYFCPPPGDPNYDPSAPCEADGVSSPNTGVIDNYNTASTTAENLGFDEGRFTYPEQVTVPANITVATPRDNDCAPIDPTDIRAMALINYQNGGYATPDDAIRDLDCSPLDIN